MWQSLRHEEGRPYPQDTNRGTLADKKIIQKVIHDDPRITITLISRNRQMLGMYIL